VKGEFQVLVASPLGNSNWRWNVSEDEGEEKEEEGSKGKRRMRRRWNRMGYMNFRAINSC
jgi:hypothetical protein